MVETIDLNTYTPRYWHLSITDEHIYVFWDNSNSREWKIEGKPAEEWEIDREEYTKYPICLRCGNDEIVIQHEHSDEYIYTNEKGEIIYEGEGEGRVTDVLCERCSSGAVMVFWIRKRDAKHLKKMNKEKRLMYILQCILRNKIAISRDVEDADVNIIARDLLDVATHIEKATIYEKVKKLAKYVTQTLTQGAKL
mgnify:CR=1 FL=1